MPGTVLCPGASEKRAQSLPLEEGAGGQAGRYVKGHTVAHGRGTAVEVLSCVKCYEITEEGGSRRALHKCDRSWLLGAEEEFARQRREAREAVGSGSSMQAEKHRFRLGGLGLGKLVLSEQS